MLVVSTDQAHSLGDVLGIAVPPTGRGAPIRVLADLGTGEDQGGGGYLDALALDTLALLESRWHNVVDALDARFPDSELSSIAPKNSRRYPASRKCSDCTRSASLRRPGDGIASSLTVPRPRTRYEC